MMMFWNRLVGSRVSRRFPLAHFGSVSGLLVSSQISMTLALCHSPPVGSTSVPTNFGPAPVSFRVAAESLLSSIRASSNYRQHHLNE